MGVREIHSQSLAPCPGRRGPEAVPARRLARAIRGGLPSETGLIARPTEFQIELAAQPLSSTRRSRRRDLRSNNRLLTREPHHGIDPHYYSANPPLRRWLRILPRRLLQPRWWLRDWRDTRSCPHRPPDRVVASWWGVRRFLSTRLGVHCVSRDESARPRSKAEPAPPFVSATLQPLSASPAAAAPQVLGTGGVGQELRQLEFGAGAEMADDLSRTQAADLAANGERQIAGQAIEEAAGVQIARPGAVDYTDDRSRRNLVLGVRRQYHAPGRATGQSGDRDMTTNRRCGRAKIIRLVQRADFGFVGEQNVDMPIDEVAECRPVPSNAKRIGKAQRHLPPRGMGNGGRFAEGFLCQRRVEKVTFEVGYPGGGDQVDVNIGRPELGTGTKIGVHRALPVGCYENETTCGARTDGCGRCFETHPDSSDVVPKYLAEKVVVHLPDICSGAAERGDPRHRVAGRPARRLDRRPHHLVERICPVRVYEGHRPLYQPLPDEKPVFGMGDHIDNRIADADDIDTGLRHLATADLGRTGGEYSRLH